MKRGTQRKLDTRVWPSKLAIAVSAECIAYSFYFPNYYCNKKDYMQKKIARATCSASSWNLLSKLSVSSWHLG
eukprot:3539705-Amphidinium_carterae.1